MINLTFVNAIYFLQHFLKNITELIASRAVKVLHSDDAFFDYISEMEFAKRIIELEGGQYNITVSLLHRLNAENKQIFFESRVKQVSELEPGTVIFKEYSEENDSYSVLYTRVL